MSGRGRQLQYTHITWDVGSGPFEIDPTYNPASGTVIVGAGDLPAARALAW